MSINLFDEAQKYLVGGVNSPVRSFKMLEITPIFIKKANGKYIYDSNKKKYIDYCLSWGAIILGHNSRVVRKEVEKAIREGLSFGFCHRYEAELAKLIQKAFPSMEKIRFVNSGTEAVMSAIRLARGFTGRKKILKFDGCYHGHSDALLVKCGSGVSEIKESSSAGVTEEVIYSTISIPFNNIEILTRVFNENGKDIACVIIEPVPANMGVIIPDENFLFILEKLCRKYDSILIFDEVITGFRVALGGAQEIFNIKPDITILGKIIGGGMPVGCFGGRTDIMDNLAPIGNVYQAGTLSGNPITIRAGIAVIKYLLSHSHIYLKMKNILENFKKEWQRKNIKLTLNVFSTIFSIFYTEKEVKNYEDAKIQNFELFKKIYVNLLKNDVLFPPSCFEACFLSKEHTEKDLEKLFNIFI